MPDGIGEKRVMEVLQNDSPLDQDLDQDKEAGSSCWLLRSLDSPVIVRWGDEDAEEIALGESSYLLFKLSGEGLKGTRVQAPSSGWYAVIVPKDWERDEAVAGPPPFGPESVHLEEEYRVHFFEISGSRDDKIAFRTPGGKVAVKPRRSRFELVGKRLPDASQYEPLFGVEPPRIRARDKDDWKDITTVVVGLEGRGQGKWRTQFHPDPATTEQELPPEIAVRPCGWYFLRFYDENDNLAESLDFRLVTALKAIYLPEETPFPSDEGHKPTPVSLFHEPDFVIRPAPTDATAGWVQVQRGSNETTLTVPPDTTCEETRWLIGPEHGQQVELTLRVERFWWAIGEESTKPREWGDRPFTLSCKDITATTKRTLWLWLPAGRQVEGLTVGFEQKRGRSYTIRKADRTVAIPLRDFCDARELKAIGEHTLRLWLSYRGKPYTLPLCNLSIGARCKRCDFIAHSTADIARHVVDQHESEFFRPLTYEEMQSRNRSLPSKIYKCPYCDFYVSEYDYSSASSDIATHVERNCKHAPRQMGAVRVSTTIVNDVNEIRENVLKNLPHTYRCKLCPHTIENPSQDDMACHLLKAHAEPASVLHELCDKGINTP